MEHSNTISGGDLGKQESKGLKMQSQSNQHSHNPMLSGFLLLSSAGLLAVAMKYSAYGFDFTDEGFYLTWISNPFIHEFSTSQFGFIYHPLYSLMEGSISGIRRVNILITWTLSSILTYKILRMAVPQSTDYNFSLLALSVAIASCSLATFHMSLSTPNYNSLNEQAALIVSLGLVLIVKDSTHENLRGWILTGIGGWLSFMAKPPTAAALAVTVLVFLSASRLLRFKPLLTAALTAIGLLLASAFLIDGSIEKFVGRLATGARGFALYDSRYSLSGIFRPLDINFTSSQKLMILAGGVASFLGGVIAHINKIRVATHLFNCLLLLGCAIAIAMASELIFWDTDLGIWIGKILLGPPLAALPFIFYALVFNSAYIPQQNHIWLAIWLFLLPLMIAFGTNGNLFDHSTLRSIFWVLAGIVLLMPYAHQQKSWQVLLPTAIVIQLLVLLVFQEAIKNPFRQSDLRLNSEVEGVKIQSSELKISEAYRDYIYAAISKSRVAGFENGDPIIDLSGQSPGLLFAMGASNIGRPWLIGGYPGSFDYVTLNLARVSCKKLAAAWVLTEPDGPRSISNDVMKSYGADLSSDYHLTGSWMTSEGAGGYEQQRKQNFYKPTHPEAIKFSCEALRETIR